MYAQCVQDYWFKLVLYLTLAHWSGNILDQYAPRDNIPEMNKKEKAAFTTLHCNHLRSIFFSFCLSVCPQGQVPDRCTHIWFKKKKSVEVKT